RDEAVAAATAPVGTGAVLDDIEREDDDGWNGWDVEIRDAGGNEYHVLVDATGTVVDVRPDDDNPSPTVTSQAPADPGAVAVDTNADIDADDQSGDGTVVTVREVRLPSTAGFVVVRTDAPDPQVPGHTAVEAADTNATIDVELDTPLTGTTRLEAVLYADDGDGVFDPAVDRIVVDEQGDRSDEQVDDDFTYTVA
ncbi:MAG: PepSY domain-containing protein, partial [Ilumatobacter sp.]